MRALFFVFIPLCLSSCAEPEACFTIDDDSVEAFEAITISNCSENSAKYLWYVDDGDTIRNFDDEEPLVAFRNVGTFQVKLIASNNRETKSDEAVSDVIVSDFCYSCLEPNSTDSAIVFCASEFNQLQDLNFTKELWETNGYVCTKQ